MLTQIQNSGSSENSQGASLTCTKQSFCHQFVYLRLKETPSKKRTNSFSPFKKKDYLLVTKSNDYYVTLFPTYVCDLLHLLSACQTTYGFLHRVWKPRPRNFLAGGFPDAVSLPQYDLG